MNNFKQAEAKLNGKMQRKIANNTYLVEIDAHAIAVRLHATNVVTYHRDGRIILNTGGWRTSTTKTRLNDYSPARISQRKGEWFAHFNGEEHEFFNGMDVSEHADIIFADGK